MGFGRGGDITYTVSGDTVTLRIESWGEYTGTMTLQKSGVDRYKVISIDGLVIDETVTDTIPIGSEFTWQ